MLLTEYKEVIRISKDFYKRTEDHEALGLLDLAMVRSGYLQPNFHPGNNWGVFDSVSQERSQQLPSALLAAMGGAFNEEKLVALLERLDDSNSHYLLPLPKPNTGLTARLFIAWLHERTHPIWIDRRGLNIVYVQSMDTAFRPITPTPDRFDDVRVCFSITQNDEIDIHHIHRVTIDPGSTFIKRPMNRLGTAFIDTGQYKAWKLGRHKGQEALVQCGPIIVRRDNTRDGIPETSPMVAMGAGLNQHRAGRNSSVVGAHSAGCLVTADSSDFEEFMTLAKAKVPKDKTYITTIIRR